MKVIMMMKRMKVEIMKELGPWGRPLAPNIFSSFNIVEGVSGSKHMIKKLCSQY